MWSMIDVLKFIHVMNQLPLSTRPPLDIISLKMEANEATCIKEEIKKQLDKGSTWAPHFPLMSKGERMLEGK